MFIALCFPAVSNATAVTGFDAGRIIDDAVFTDSSSMDVNQIQAFLNSKVTNCDTNGTQPATDFGRSDLTHAQYAASRGWPAPPYPCLKDYTDYGLSAAQIIYYVAHHYNINPQVLIVLLQKEQGLVTDIWPLPVQYRSATGYGCPDTAACDSQFYGLTAQLHWAGTMFHAIESNSQNWSNPYRSGTSWYTPYILGNNYIQYSPDAACGGTTINIQNRATQSLYNYTPYQPNQASLNAGYGTGDSCSSHGNRNFYLYFSDWFGSTLGVHEGSVIELNTPTSGVYLIENGVKRPFSSVEAFYSHNYTWANVITVNKIEFDAIPTGQAIDLVILNGNVIKLNTPTSGVYLIENGVKRPFSSVEAFYSHNYKWANVITVSESVFNAFPTGQTIGLNLAMYNYKVIRLNTPTSGVYLIEGGVKRPFSSVEAFYSHNYTWANVITVSESVFNAIPTGKIIPKI